MKLRAFVFGAALLGLASCGGSDDLCDKAAAYAKKCGEEVPTAAELMECREDLKTLSASCKSAFSAMISCASKLPCDADVSELDEKCGPQLEKFTTECEDSLGE